MVAKALLTVLLCAQARDLAVLGCSCTELRHTAGSDAFWQVLFKQEFGYAPELDSIQGSSLRWQRLFGRTWLNRCVPWSLNLMLDDYCQLAVVSDMTLMKQLGSCNCNPCLHAHVDKTKSPIPVSAVSAVFSICFWLLCVPSIS